MLLTALVAFMFMISVDALNRPLQGTVYLTCMSIDCCMYADIYMYIYITEVEIEQAPTSKLSDYMWEGLAHISCFKKGYTCTSYFLMRQLNSQYGIFKKRNRFLALCKCCRCDLNRQLVNLAR